MATMTSRASAAAASPAICVRPAGVADRCRLGQAAGHAEPPNRPEREVGRAGGEQLLVGVDPVAASGGEEPGRAQALRQAHQGERRSGGEQAGQIGGVDGRYAGRRQPTRDRADDLDPARLQIQRRGRRQAAEQDQQTPRELRDSTVAAEEDQRARPPTRPPSSGRPRRG